jgi:hypothetical protein
VRKKRSSHLLSFLFFTAGLHYNILYMKIVMLDGLACFADKSIITLNRYEPFIPPPDHEHAGAFRKMQELGFNGLTDAVAGEDFQLLSKMQQNFDANPGAQTPPRNCSLAQRRNALTCRDSPRTAVEQGVIDRESCCLPPSHGIGIGMRRDGGAHRTARGCAGRPPPVVQRRSRGALLMAGESLR